MSPRRSLRLPSSRRSSSSGRRSTATSEPSNLTSLRNPRVQRARRLLRRASRREEQAFLLEGNRAIRDAIDVGAPVEELFVVDELAGDRVVELARRSGATVHVVGWPIVKAISDSVTPQGMVAVIDSPLRGLGDIDLVTGLALVLAGVNDPGNAGTLIRTAAAAGADAVVMTEGSADPLNPKTARASASALFATTLVADVSLEEAASSLSDLGYQLVGAESGAPSSIYEADLSGSVALVLGNESWGLPDSQRDLLETVVSIPMPGRMESLNVATAGTVIAFEILRQRRGNQNPTVSSGTKEGLS